MKLNCGPSAHEKWRSKVAKQNEYAVRVQQWHRIYAWFPIRVGEGDCRWLEYVERQDINWWRRYDFNDWERICGTTPTWKYRAITE